MGKKKEKEINALKLRKVKSKKNQIKSFKKKMVTHKGLDGAERTYFVMRYNLLRAIDDFRVGMDDYIDSSNGDTTDIANWIDSRLNVRALCVLDGKIYMETIGIPMDSLIIFKLPKCMFEAVTEANSKIDKIMLILKRDKNIIVKYKFSDMIFSVLKDRSTPHDRSYYMRNPYPRIVYNKLKANDGNKDHTLNLIDVASKIYFTDKNGRKKVKDIVVL